MSGEEKNSRPNRKKHSRRKGIRRRIVQCLIGLVAVLLLLCLAIAGTAYYAYHNKVEFLNSWLGKIDPNHAISLEEFLILEPGKIEIGNLRIRSKHPADSDDLVQVEKILLTYDPAALRTTRKLDSIVIQRPVIAIGEEDYRTLASGNRPLSRSPLSLLSHFTGSLQVKEGDLFLDPPHAPPVRAKWSLQTAGPGFDENGISRFPVEAELREFSLGESGKLGGSPLVKTRFRFGEDLRRFQVEHLTLTSPAITLTPEWFVAPGTTQSRERAGKHPEKPRPEILLSRVLLNDAEIRVQGFDGRRDDLPRIADIHFRTGIDWRNLSYREGRIESEDSLLLEAGEISLRGGRAVLVEAASATFLATSLGAVVHDRHLEAVTVRDGVVRISDDSLSLWRESAPREPREWRPFHVGVFEAIDAAYVMDGFTSKRTGHVLPFVSTRFKATLREVEINRRGMSSDAIQYAELADFVLRGPGADPGGTPLIAFPLGELNVNWDRYLYLSEIESLTIRTPVIRLTDETLGGWATERNEPTLIGPRNRTVFRLPNLEIQDGRIEADTGVAFGIGIPNLKATFSVKNEDVGQQEEELGYRLKIADFHLGTSPGKATPPPTAPGDVLAWEAAEIEFTATGIQRLRKVKRLKISGGSLRPGKGLEEVIGGLLSSGN